MSRFPLSMHRLEGGEIRSVTAFSKQDEDELLAVGYSPKVPRLPVEDAMQAAPVNLIPQVSAEQLAEACARIAALEDRVEKLEAKRGPGRPAKEKSE